MLAIGDGGRDAYIIQCAHVCIGISIQMGMQAVYIRNDNFASWPLQLKAYGRSG